MGWRMTRGHWPWLIGLLTVGITVAASLLWVPTRIEFEVLGDVRYDRVEAFYSTQAAGYSRERGAIFNGGAPRFVRYQGTLSHIHRLHTVRLDPTRRADTVKLRNLRVTTRWGTFAPDAETIADTLFGLNHADNIRVEDNALVMDRRGHDPHFSLLLPAGMYRPGPVAAVGLLVIALCLGAAAGLMTRTGLRRSAGRKALRALDRFGQKVASPSTTMLSLVAALGIGGAAIFHFQIANITPPLQGPDEMSHAVTPFNTLYQYRQGPGAESCPMMPTGLLGIFEVVADMRLRYDVQIDIQRLQSLQNVSLQGLDRVEEPAQDNWDARTCHIGKAFHSHAYNTLPTLAMAGVGELSAVGYLSFLRWSNVLLALLLSALTAWPIAKGRFVLEGIIDAPVGAIRVAVLLGFLLFLFIPQNLFMTGVISREAYMLPLGAFVTVAFFFRHRWLTPVMLVLAVYAFWPRRAPYLLMIGLLLTFYLSVWLAQRTGKPGPLFVPSGLVVLAVILAPVGLLAVAALAPSLPIRVPADLMILENFWHFHQEFSRFTILLLSLQIFSPGSFFGLLGSMDTPLPTWLAGMFRGGLIVAALAGGIGWLWQRQWASPGQGRGGAGRRHSSLVGWAIILLLLAMVFVAATIMYGGFQVYSTGGRHWGWGVQGRYFLPVYGILMTVPILLALAAWTPTRWSTASPRRVGSYAPLGLVTLLIGLALMLFGFIAGTESLAAIEQRYFLDERVAEGYQRWLRSARWTSP